MKPGTTLVFGGKSPIALAVANNLFKIEKKCILLTRDMSNFDMELLSSTNVSVQEFDLVSPDLDFLRELIQLNDIDSIVFMHRYVDKEVSIERRFTVEIFSPLKVIEVFLAASKAKSKSVVFGSSPSARVVQQKQTPGYHMSKAALNAMMRTFAATKSKDGSRFNVVSPGAYIEKDRSKNYYDENPLLVKSIRELVPIGRFGLPEDVSSAVNFLLSNDALYINGTVIEVDGGMSTIDPASL